MEGGARGVCRGTTGKIKAKKVGGASGQDPQVQRTEAQGRDPHSPQGSWRPGKMEWRGTLWDSGCDWEW